MIALRGAGAVLPGRVAQPATILLDGDRIAEIVEGARAPSARAVRLDLTGHLIVPGFIDVHVHGAGGDDTLDGPGAIASIAARLPRYGVTAFCPTSVACAPAALDTLLGAVRDARTAPRAASARVLPAHLESNFINPAYRGAQPDAMLRLPGSAAGTGGQDFSAADLLDAIERGRPDVAIITMAPELPGALDLVAALVSRGHRVALGHSAATYEEALAAIARGARHATHLFNRMPPLGHRDPGLAGAVLAREEIAAEIICDGYHVHPAVVRMAAAAKGPSRVMAITDGTALSGLRPGACARLGGRTITAGDHAATLEDGTLAGSTCTMDRAFRMLVESAGLPLVDAAALCATTPARELGLTGHGVIAAGAVADLAVLDADLRVVQTYVGGTLVYSAGETPVPGG
jgi:N-acetylglucosamine-6-phosphate deacetylase